jgi:4'-phosphopantetheinyl transferase
MAAPGWLSRRAGDVPSGDAWLGVAEREVLAGLRCERRRDDWRLGRWTAKCAVGSWLGMEPERVAVLPAKDGAPEAWLDGLRPVPLSLSLSHREGMALAAVSHVPGHVGCDLELIEPRSDAFVREWLDPAEQRVVFGAPAAARALLANAIWSAKEAASKVLREGLRLDVRDAVVSLAAADSTGAGVWHPAHVSWRGALPSGTSSLITGWWRVEQPFVMVLLADPPLSVPRRLPLLAQTA